MKKRIFLLFGTFLMFTSFALAALPSTYEFVLSKDNPAEEILSNGPVQFLNGGVLAFDYWYVPDPFPEYQPNPLLAPDFVPQDFCLTRSGSFLQFGRIYCFTASSQWHSAVLEMPHGNEVTFTMPLYTGLDCFETDSAGSRIMDNRIFVNNIQAYGTYSEWLADHATSCQEPVPEPATAAMFATGVIGFLGLSRVRRRR